MRTTLGILAALLAIGSAAFYLNKRRGMKQQKPDDESANKDLGDSRKPRKPETDPFVTAIFSNIAKSISPSLNANVADVRDAFIRWRETGIRSDLLAKFVKVECSFVKKSASVVTVTPRIAQTKEDKIKITTFEQDTPWEELPQEIRSEFIRNGGKEHVFVLCEMPSSVPAKTQN
jgi:hypothetical protein